MEPPRIRIRQGARDDIVAYLRRSGTTPIIHLAAEACGIDRDMVKDWIKRGLQGELQFVAFAREVSKIRAEWLQAKAAELLACENKTQAAAIQWMMSKVDGETFDAPRAGNVRGPYKPRATKTLGVPEDPDALTDALSGTQENAN
jgi:hypothetical protein